MATEIAISFTLRGKNFDPAEVTDFLELTPTSVWRNGDTILKTTMLHKDCGWRIQAVSESEFDIEPAVVGLVTQLKPRIHKIDMALSKYDLTSELECVIYVDNDVPAMNINSDIVSVLSKIGASIDIDLYLVSEPDNL